jgi:hypothetical protein
MTTTRPPFFEVLDSTIVSSFRACPQMAYQTYIRHYKPKTPSVHLHAGGAFAHGLEVGRTAFFLHGKPESECIELAINALLKFYGDFECPSDSAKSAERMAMALAYYFDAYPMSKDPAPPTTLSDGRRGIEFSFAEPIDATHPETGDPILYVGRMDMIVDFAGGRYGEDDKTTSSLGASWAKQWDMRSQFTGYCWGAARGGIKLDGFLVRGIAILKTKFDTQQAITYRPQWMIDRWYEQLIADVTRMKACWESGMWDYNLDHSCEDYGGCSLKNVCLSPEPERWLRTNFTRRVWDPVKREERILED